MSYRRRMPDLSYLNVKPEAQDAYDALNRALDEQRGLCYDNPDLFTSESVGTDADQCATAMVECFHCPVLEQCRAFARLEQPEGPIVQGGEFYPETKLEEDAVQDH